MQFRWLLAFAAAASLATADTLTLRNGRTVTGSYLGGSSRQIRMAVGDSIETFAISDVASIRFDAGETAAEVKPAAAPAPALSTRPVTAQPARDNEIPAGTAITIRMIDDVDSPTAAAGQTYRASIDEPVVIAGRTVIPRGADVVTRLVELKEPGKLAGGGQLTLDLDSITVDGKRLEVSSEAVTTEGESRKNESAKVIGGTAALGAIIGAIAGGGRGAAIGAVSGAGAGTAVQVLTKGTRVRVPSETRLTFTLQQPIRL